jgi:para-aminobenzoate synthetase
LRVKRLERLCDGESAFAELYGESESAFWLDSSRADRGARFSFLGDDRGPLGAVITYDVEAAEVRVHRHGRTEVVAGSIFDYLARELPRFGLAETGLPFEFGCGFAGYFGYELKADCEGDAVHAAATPDAAFVFADRLIALDHRERRTYLLTVADADGAEEAEWWLEETSSRLAELRPAERPNEQEHDGGGELTLDRSRTRYLEDIEGCKRRLVAGETYEVCLTNTARLGPVDAPFSLYRRLRRANPAPFAAFLRFGDLAVLSSSPERFLRIGADRWAEARPIKGTRRRGSSSDEDAALAAGLRTDEKSRAENVTIVDLLRNDLGKVCEFGSVSVPARWEVESYETVHQLVSTVRGRLRRDASAIEAVRACFPPGSMTGAPKKRTMEIIDELEGSARGVYSGAIGYLGLGGGCDLSVAIRTIVADASSTSIGAGGAIVLQSNPEDEWEEMLLKLRAPARALDPGCGC